MGEMDNRRIREYLGALRAFQTSPYPLKTVNFPGSNYINPINIPAMSMERHFQPVMSCHHMNITEQVIRSTGMDAWERYWHSLVGANLTGIESGFLVDQSQFYVKHNSIDASKIVTATNVNVASSASLVLTVTAGHSYFVRNAGIQNNTRAFDVALAFTPNGGTAAIWTTTDTFTPASTMNVVGTGSQSGIGDAFCLEPFWMQAGDTLEISNPNFVAADVMRKQFIYEDYTLA
jgi:hypothetical protein